jgi:hypothetical protein
MGFSVRKLHELQKDMEVVFSDVLSKGKVSKLLELNAIVLMRLNKDSLTDMIVNLVHVFEQNMNLCKVAAERIDEV